MTASIAHSNEKPQTGGLSKCLQALECTDFRLYLSGQAASALGTGMQNVALGWMTYRVTHSATALSLLAAALVLPQILLSFAGGCLADGKRRKLVLISLQFAGAMVAGLLLCGSFAQELNQTLMIALAFVYGSFVALEYPARHAFTGRMVQPHILVSARGLYSASCAATLALGQLAAGFIIESGAEWGERACFFLNMVSYLVSVLVLSKVGTAKKAELKVSTAHGDHGAEVTAMKSAAHETGPGVKYCLDFVLSSGPIFQTFLQTAILVLFCLRYISFLPAFASEVFHGGAGASGMLSASLAIGYAVAAFVCGGFRSKESLNKLATVSLLLLPAALVMFALSPCLPMGVACVFAMAFLQSANINACVATMQVTAPDWIFGRLMGLRITMVALLELTAALIAGQLVHGLGLSSTMILVACLGAMLAIPTSCGTKLSTINRRVLALNHIRKNPKR